MLRDDKETFRGKRQTEYPVSVRTYDRREVVANTREELFQLLTDTERKDGSITTRIMAAGIHPEQFISGESEQLLALFSRFKRYGLTALYGGEDTPALVLQAFDVVQNTIDGVEAKKFRAMKEQSKRK